VECGRGGVELPYGAPWRSCASWSRLPAPSLYLSQLQPPGVPALRGRRAGAVDAQAGGAALAGVVLSADADGSSGDTQRVPALSRGDGSGVLCSHCQCAESVVRPQEVPRWEYRIHSDLAYMDPADALSSPHPCARSGSGSRSAASSDIRAPKSISSRRRRGHTRRARQSIRRSPGIIPRSLRESSLPSG
jgi:hypothetical protein